MSEVKDLEIVEPEGCEIQQDDTMTLAKAVAGSVAEELATAPKGSVPRRGVIGGKASRS
jgi:ribosomal protein L6P/L9E